MYIQDKVEEYADEVFDLLVRFFSVGTLQQPQQLPWGVPTPAPTAERQDGLPFLHHAAVAVLQDNGAHIFFCGLKGMMPGIQEMLERVAKVSLLFNTSGRQSWRVSITNAACVALVTYDLSLDGSAGAQVCGCASCRRKTWTGRASSSG